MMLLSEAERDRLLVFLTAELARARRRRGLRRLEPGSMTRHGRLGRVRAEPGTGRTTLDGELLAAPAAESVPLSRLYFL